MRCRRHVSIFVDTSGVHRYMKKGETPETMIRGADIIRAAGINISTGFIIGLPGENDETVRSYAVLLTLHMFSLN